MQASAHLVSVQEIITQGSVDFEDASRLEFDRRRHAELLHTGLQNRVDPASADRLFIRLLVAVLNKACLLHPAFLNPLLCASKLCSQNK